MKIQSSNEPAAKRGIFHSLKMKAGILCSLTVLAAPAANQCEAAPAIPCNVQTVLASKCQTCHQTPPQNGAPYALQTYAQTREQAPGFPSGTLKWQRMRDRVNGNTMPPIGYPQLSTAERSTLTNWFNAGAPAGAACAP